MVVKQRFWGHVALSARSVSDFLLLLEMRNLLDGFVVFKLQGLVRVIELDLGEAEIDEQTCPCVLVVQEVRRLDISVHYSFVR